MWRQVLIGLLGYAAANEYPRMDEEADWYGFTYTAHDVTTDDGYILTAFRLTGDEDGPYNLSKPPVVIVHGMSMDGPSWLDANFYNPSDVLPFQLMLAEAGYDVYIANNRGTEYSRGHTTLDAAEDAEYWDFSWAEMGLYDDKALISLAVS